MAKVIYMFQHHDLAQTLRVSSAGEEFVDIQLESSRPVTVRLQMDGGCNCQHNNGPRPGSYVDNDLGSR